MWIFQTRSINTAFIWISNGWRATEIQLKWIAYVCLCAAETMPRLKSRDKSFIVVVVVSSRAIRRRGRINVERGRNFRIEPRFLGNWLDKRMINSSTWLMSWLERATNAKIISIFDEAQSIVNSTDNILAAAELCSVSTCIVACELCGCERDILILSLRTNTFICLLNGLINGRRRQPAVEREFICICYYDKHVIFRLWFIFIFVRLLRLTIR